MPILLSIVRHLLTLAAGGLLTIGVTEEAAQGLAKAAEPVVAGAVVYGVSQAWSIVDKKKKKK